MNQLFSQLKAFLLVVYAQAILTAQEANRGFGLLKQYVDNKVATINTAIGDIAGQISTAVEAAKTTLRSETDSKIQVAKDQEITARNAAIATAKTGAENFATSLVGSEATERSLAIGNLAAATAASDAAINTDLTATKARISAIETSDAGSADDFLPYTIVPGTTSNVSAVLAAAAQALNVTPEADRTYLLLFGGGGGVQTMIFTDANGVETNYDVNAGEKMRVKIGTNGSIQYVIHIPDPYAEQLSSVEFGIGEINTALALQNTALVNAVSTLTGTVNLLAAAVAAQSGN